MESKEKWIDETMDALEGVSRAESDPLLFDKVMKRLEDDSPVFITLRSRMVWRAAALILVLISFNVITLVWFSGNKDDSRDTVTSVANEYFSYIDSINF